MAEVISLGESLRVFEALSLIYSTFCYHGFGDASYGDESISISVMDEARVGVGLRNLE